MKIAISIIPENSKEKTENYYSSFIHYLFLLIKINNSPKLFKLLSIFLIAVSGSRIVRDVLKEKEDNSLDTNSDSLRFVILVSFVLLLFKFYQSKKNR